MSRFLRAAPISALAPRAPRIARAFRLHADICASAALTNASVRRFAHSKAAAAAVAPSTNTGTAASARLVSGNIPLGMHTDIVASTSGSCFP
jgi:hypothetical protein